MTRIFSIVASFFFVVSGALAQSDASPIVRLQTLVLPEFKVERVTLQEGLDVVRQAWTRQYSKEAFPVVVSESFPTRSDAQLRATMHLKNVPALAAVTYLAQGASMSVRHGLDVVVLRPMVYFDEGAWESVMLTLTDRAIRLLELPAKENGDTETANRALRKRTEEYGVNFEPGFEIRWYARDKWIFIRNTPAEIAKVRAVVSLLDNGYTLRKGAK